MNNRVKTVEAGREFRNFIKTMKDIKFVNIKRYKIIVLGVRKTVELIDNSMKNWLKFSQKLAKKNPKTQRFENVRAMVWMNIHFPKDLHNKRIITVQWPIGPLGCKGNLTGWGIVKLNLVIRDTALNRTLRFYFLIFPSFFILLLP